MGERTRDQQDLRKVLGAPAPALRAEEFVRSTAILGQYEAIPQTLLSTGNHLGYSEPKFGLKWGSEVGEDEMLEP
ncbi:hypothetical protein BOTCAL_0056g00080 [Botryotinia calthae]|uniref:Uncharacterized protein n=1 Tax=Botryotinia calthae TaxID=38488 RepID=A0A4Y8DAG2_9HELO|nr:hypothetical protein BOTCAL_0056g00080 [Botryotinia calthae]